MHWRVSKATIRCRTSGEPSRAHAPMPIATRGSVMIAVVKSEALAGDTWQCRRNDTSCARWREEGCAPPPARGGEEARGVRVDESAEPPVEPQILRQFS